ncbi:hypothetical protein PHJA_002303000 [Phtheirospermum japonicum]|uniref:Uncharacterized protein n=1 Tax=Phtheirospermum japonicum TaxID=374723 RepID=A0A830CP61_9LAMI|nr:hypothetical protein PHJA_002303000 [Phtheirospermum japonicum]
MRLQSPQLETLHQNPRSRSSTCSSSASSMTTGHSRSLPHESGGSRASVAAAADRGRGELFRDSNWASDVSDQNSRRVREGSGGGERKHSSDGCGQFGNYDNQGNESGYGSEPGYRGDTELGYGDEEDDDPWVLFWRDEIGADNDSKLERLAKTRCRKLITEVVKLSNLSSLKPVKPKKLTLSILHQITSPSSTNT